MLDLAILDGVRSPFVKAFGPLAHVPAQELGRLVTVELLRRTDTPADHVDQVVFGNAASPPEAANVARVIALLAGIPHNRIAHCVHRNCASGFESIAAAAQLLRLGEARRVAAGGVESMSRIPLLFSAEATARFLDLAKAKGWWQRLRALARFRPWHFQPVPALKLGLTDPVSGLIMGETAEVLADDFSIRREDQDAYAVRSHHRAAAADFSDEIVPVPDAAARDVGPRRDQSLEALGKLRPYFRKNGTVTVGNSCSITDGAGAILLVSGELVRAEGRTPLGYLRGVVHAGCEPRRMGLGPVFATAKLLDKLGMTLADFDLVELNEAFAAQVLACFRAFASAHFARDHLGRAAPLGELDPEKVNVNGGAIALGHPIGATGIRLVVTLLRELQRRNLRRGLATLCVAGGQGGAIAVERP